jgi:hypothetical protein
MPTRSKWLRLAHCRQWKRFAIGSGPPHPASPEAITIEDGRRSGCRRRRRQLPESGRLACNPRRHRFGVGDSFDDYRDLMGEPRRCRPRRPRLTKRRPPLPSDLHIGCTAAARLSATLEAAGLAKCRRPATGN